METKKGLKELEEALSKDEALRNTYEIECKRIAEAKEAANDAEVMVKAADKLGFELSLAELEREMADKEALNDDELENISGGDTILDVDEHGHNNWCITLWHCFMYSMHTESERTGNACLSNYRCVLVYKQK